MARCPFARWAPAGTPGGAIDPRVVILHTEATVGKAQPHDGLEWHFMVFNNGAIDQLVDTNRRADANNKANGFAISIETEDDGSPDDDRWTPAQAAAIVLLLRWLHEQHNIPLVRCPDPFGSGIGYHTMFGAPSAWTPVVKSCPGAARKAQFDLEILPALTSGDDLMGAADDILAKLESVETKVERTFNQINLKTGGLANSLATLVAEVAGVKSAIGQLGAGGNIDYGKVEAAAAEAVKDVLGGVDEDA